MKMFRLTLFTLLFTLPLSALAGSTDQLETLPSDPLDKSIMVRAYVPDLAAGIIGGVWDIALSNVMSFGPIMKVFAFGKYSGYYFGLNVNYSLSGDLFHNGWVLNPYAEYARTNYHQPFNGSDVRQKADTGIIGANLMYEWIWDSGLNIMAGLGLEYANEDIPVTMLTDSHFHPTFEVTIGYAF